MKPTSAQSKGKRLEEFVCQQIEEMGLGRSVRTPGSGSGKKKGDVFNNLEFMLECKNEKQTNLLKNIDQAKRDCEKGNYFKEKWCLITRDPRKAEFEEVYATIDLWQFLTLLKKESEPKVKEPDRTLKYKLERLKQITKEVIKELE